MENSPLLLHRLNLLRHPPHVVWRSSGEHVRKYRVYYETFADIRFKTEFPF